MIAINKIALLDIELMKKMSAKRLLSVYKNVRSCQLGLLCDCGCGDRDEVAWDIYEKRINLIKSILATKPHIERKGKRGRN